jgi:plastocyanin
MKTFSKFLVVGVLAAVAACSCSGGYGTDTTQTRPPVDDGKTVNATPSEVFTPATLTVKAGDAVTFAFGGVAHNVFFDAAAGAPADIPNATENASVQRTFPTAGSYSYTCHIHPSMHGTVLVQ